MKQALRIISFIASFLFLLSTAQAQDEKAQKLFNEAELYFKASKFEKAADLYTEAFVASQIPDLLFNVAQCYKNLKNYENTLKTFKQYMFLVSASDDSLAENVAGLERIKLLLPDLEAENDFPKKNTTVKKLLKESKELVAALLSKAASLPKPSVLSITGTSDASVFLDDIKLEGKTPVEILKTKKGSHKLSIKRDGYFSWSKSFEVAGDGKAISFLVELVPIVLEVQGTPGADVIINGEIKGKVPFRAEGIKQGAYAVSVKLAGHRDWSADVILPSSSNQSPVMLTAELEPFVLEINGADNAELFLDGDLQGRLPATVEKISVGKHKLAVKLAGFETWTGEVTVSNEKISYAQKVELKPASKKDSNPAKAGSDKSRAPLALYGVAALSAGAGVAGLLQSTKLQGEATTLLSLNQPSLIDLVATLDKQSKQLGAASAAAFVVAAGAAVGGVLLMNKKPEPTALNLSLTLSGVTLSGRF